MACFMLTFIYPIRHSNSPHSSTYTTKYTPHQNSFIPLSTCNGCSPPTKYACVLSRTCFNTQLPASYNRNDFCSIGTYIYEITSFNNNTEFINTSLIATTSTTKLSPNGMIGIFDRCNNSEYCFFKILANTSEAVDIFFNATNAMISSGYNTNFDLDNNNIKKEVPQISTLCINMTKVLLNEEQYPILKEDDTFFQMDSTYKYIGIPDDLFAAYSKMICKAQNCTVINGSIAVGLNTTDLMVPTGFVPILLKTDTNIFNISNNDSVKIVKASNESGFLYWAISMVMPANRSFIMGIPFLRKYFIRVVSGSSRWIYFYGYNNKQIEDPFEQQ